MRKTSNLTGRQFGRLTALEQAPRTYSGNRYRVAWRCKCQCGNELTVASDSLLGGSTSSCGCLHSEVISIHKGSNMPEYQVWRGILGRCYNKQFHAFDAYGGRGIAVCDRWRFGENGRHPFECFIADVGLRPLSLAGSRSEFSIDRIDNNDGYRPGNVRWATSGQQARNRRSYKGGIQRCERGKYFRVRISAHWCCFRTFEDARAAIGEQ